MRRNVAPRPGTPVAVLSPSWRQAILPVIDRPMPVPARSARPCRSWVVRPRNRVARARVPSYISLAGGGPEPCEVRGSRPLAARQVRRRAALLPATRSPAASCSAIAVARLEILIVDLPPRHRQAHPVVLDLDDEGLIDRRPFQRDFERVVERHRRVSAALRRDDGSRPPPIGCRAPAEAPEPDCSTFGLI